MRGHDRQGISLIPRGRGGTPDPQAAIAGAGGKNAIPEKVQNLRLAEEVGVVRGRGVDGRELQFDIRIGPELLRQCFKVREAEALQNAVHAVGEQVPLLLGEVHAAPVAEPVADRIRSLHSPPASEGSPPGKALAVENQGDLAGAQQGATPTRADIFKLAGQGLHDHLLLVQHLVHRQADGPRGGVEDDHDGAFERGETLRFPRRRNGAGGKSERRCP